MSPLLAGAAAAAAPPLILHDHAVDHEIRMHGEHRSVPVIRKFHHAKSPPGFTVQVGDRRADIESNDTQPAIGDMVVVAVGPGPKGRILLADDREAHAAAHGDAIVVPILLALLILGLGWGGALPRYRAARAAIRSERVLAMITAKTVEPCPYGRVRRTFRRYGGLWIIDLTQTDGTTLRWQGILGWMGGRPGETVTLLGDPTPGGWVVIAHSLPGDRSRVRYAWPDRPLQSGIAVSRAVLASEDGEPGPTYSIDGTRVRSLEGFWTVIGQTVNGPGGYFASNLDALSDALNGGMGRHDGGRCTFVWEDSEASRRALGYEETARQLELRLSQCHPSNSRKVAAELEAARAGTGRTVFEWLVEIFEDSPATLTLR